MIVAELREILQDKKIRDSMEVIVIDNNRAREYSTVRVEVIDDEFLNEHPNQEKQLIITI